MRVLDLGCGRAMTSVFLAREFGVTVWAADLWIEPTENWERIRAGGLQDVVYPMKAEAHDLPFPDGFFDAVVSVDAYQYFGTDDLYIGYITRFLRPGGRLAIAAPGLVEELDAVPEHLEPFGEWDFACFHTPQWWRRHWEFSGRVEVEVAEHQRYGWRHWRRWSDMCAAASDREFVRTMSVRSAKMLEVDAGRTFTFPLVVGRVP
ncbi:MAG: SAM-dependent methyltransferase [Jiangellaceae bacterium]